MEWLVFVGLCIIVVFGSVVLFGAPYVPTLKSSTEDIFQISKLQPGQHLLELGSGDGRVLLAAARRGIYATGYELNPFLVIISTLITWRYRKYVTVKWANFWQTEWPATDVIYVFLLQKYMGKLDKKIVQQVSKPVKVVSYAFTIPDKNPIMTHKGMSVYKYQ